MVGEALRDPLCGMTVRADSPHRLEHAGRTFRFCNPRCLERFRASPAAFLAPAGPAQAEPGRRYTCPMHPEIVRDAPGSCPLCGMALEPMNVAAEEEESAELVDMRRRFVGSAVLTLPLFALAMAEMWTPIVHGRAGVWLQLALATPVVLWGGWPFFARGWASLLSRRLNMFPLIALGTGAAYGFSLAAALAPGLFPDAFRGHGGAVPVYFSGFYSGVRKTVMQPEEMLVDIFFKAMKSNQAGTFIKVGLRKVQAIAVVNAAMIVTFSGEKPLIRQRSPITEARITLGAFAPTIIRAHHAESYLNKSTLSENVIAQTAERATREAKPIDDIRGSAAYRNAMVRVCIKRGLEAISRSEERLGFPLNPVLLKSPKTINNNHGLNRSIRHDASGTIKTNINGKVYKFKTSNSKTLLRLLREDAGLLAARLEVYPNLRMTPLTRSLVSGATSSLLFRTRDTVEMETPAASATS